jgi:hypothetical protein
MDFNRLVRGVHRRENGVHGEEGGNGRGVADIDGSIIKMVGQM